jgi:YebC/PmpR family DNA-binding regulatory protein
MSGHSKWHSIKHAKGAADAARGKVFARLARQIEVAAREGGGDVDGNPTLRAMVQKARDASMPKDNIERAIKRGTGELEGVTYEAITYEGYATNGVAVYVEALTDNRNRTGAEVKNVFTRNGGSLAEPGAVAWQFERKGVIILDKAAAEEDDLMLAALDAGAEDIADQGDTWQVTTAATDLNAVRTALADAGIEVKEHELTMLPTSTVELGDASKAKSVLRVIDALEEHDDVQNVYANFDIPDDVLAAAYA